MSVMTCRTNPRSKEMLQVQSKSSAHNSRSPKWDCDSAEAEHAESQLQDAKLLQERRHQHIRSRQALRVTCSVNTV